MALVIRRKVSLAFLGEEYKDGFLTFRAIPLKDYEKIIDEIETIGEDNKKSLTFISGILDKYYVSGKAPNEEGQLEDVAKEDLGNLDSASVLECFQALTGHNVRQESDFLDKDSNKPSSTEEGNPEN